MLAISIFGFFVVIILSLSPINLERNNLIKDLSTVQRYVENNKGTLFTDGIVKLQVDHNNNLLMVIVDVDKWEYNFEEDQLLQKKWQELTGHSYSVAYFDSKTMECCHAPNE